MSATFLTSHVSNNKHLKTHPLPAASLNLLDIIKRQTVGHVNMSQLELVE